MQNYDLIVERIANSSGLQKEEVERRIEAKRAKLSGLISKEGAAQIIASELGINFEEIEIKISELMAGMKRVNVFGKIIALSSVREYQKSGRRGKVANLILADETSNVKVVLWDMNHISLIEKKQLKENDVVEIKNASMRDQELHLSGFSDIKKSSKVVENVKTEIFFHEKAIKDANQGQNIKIRGIVAQMFNPRFFFVCPECGKKVSQDSGKFICQEHGNVSAKERALLNFILDDGTETLRIVLFSEQLAKIANEEELKDFKKLTFFREEMLGTEFYVSGIVTKNQLFNNLEIIARDIEKVDVENLIQRLEKEN